MPEQPLPQDDALEAAATKGRKLIVLSVDEHLSLALEECPLPGYLLAGVADWLSLYAETLMCEEMTETEED